ncbi:hypothetical protein C2S53_005029, partial [Perilla frutescens var. hirtella]
INREMEYFSSNFIVAIHFIVMLLVLTVHGSITSDKEALISFKSQVFSDSNPLSTWDEKISPCNWTGVSCDELGNHVVSLHLSGLRLTGSISPHLGNLSSLTSLELQNNQLSGPLPDHLGNLIRLRTLNLSFNSLGGVIPSNLSRCKDLRQLDLMQNQISGKVPPEIWHFAELQTLNLARNQLAGDFPSSIANISSLVDLNVGTNKFGGPIPSSLSRLTNLKRLDLTINNLSGTVPPSIYNMSSLVYLALASNDLWGDLPGDIAVTLPNLLGFNFCFNKFTGTIPWSLHNLTNIQIIRMAHNLLHGSVPPGLGNLPNLEMYNIGFNSIVGLGDGGLDFLELLTNSTRLNFLAIDGNLLNGTIPKSIGNLSKVLTKLYMGENDIYGSIPPSISELKALQLLDLGDGSISLEIPSEIGQLNELRVLRLTNNMLSGTIPSSLGNLKQLTKLDLSKNKLVGNIPTTFGNFENLISLDLSENNLNGTIPTELVKLPSLSVFLNLSRNQLTGSLPEEIGSLENVAIVNICDNMISGNISRSIGNCKSLEQLLLARNMLSGEIPVTLGDVMGLETLDLSSNQLSGKIPLDLQNLKLLQLLNLSHNNLEGEIPTTGVFADPSKVHLESNHDLCLGLSCRTHRGRNLTLVYIVVSVAAVVSLCFTVGVIWYVRRRQRMMKKGSFESFVKSQPPMVSYNDLRLATDGFSEDNVVGRGSFGSVYRGILEGAAVAVKVLDTTIAKSRKSFLAECKSLRHVRHRNLVKLVTVCASIDAENEDFLALIFEFMCNGSLDDWISGRRRRKNADNMRFNLLERLRFAIGIASAIDYLHNETEAPVVHCDLKPSNILLDSDLTPKVADFGLAKLLVVDANNQTSISSTHTLKGSIGYIPPEYGYGVKPSTAGDVYSYGILLLELFTWKNPTHEMFGGGVSLRSWVQQQFPTNVEKVLDVELVEQMNKFCSDEEIMSPSCKLPQSRRDCLVTVIGVGLSCAAESPEARISIRDALRKLKSVQQILQKQEFANGGHEHCSLQLQIMD